MQMLYSVIDIHFELPLSSFSSNGQVGNGWNQGPNIYSIVIPRPQ